MLPKHQSAPDAGIQVPLESAESHLDVIRRAIEEHPVDDRSLEVILEPSEVTEHPLAHEVNHGVVLHQIVLEGGPGQRHPPLRPHLLDGHRHLLRGIEIRTNNGVQA